MSATLPEDAALSRLEWSVRALAQPASTQRRLFPEFVCVADELALEFDEALRLVQKHETAISDDDNSHLEKVDSLIVSISGEANAHFWTDEALEIAPEWEEIRAAALHLIRTMGWSPLAPSPSAHVYVGENA